MKKIIQMYNYTFDLGEMLVLKELQLEMEAT